MTISRCKTFMPGTGAARVLGAGALSFVLLSSAQAQAAELPQPDLPIEVPSGQDVRFVEMIEDENGPLGLTMRFRFIAPGIGRETGSVDAETALADMQAICDSLALPFLTASGSKAVQIIVSLSDVPVVFGEPTPEATQFVEAYSFEDGACMWEPL